MRAASVGNNIILEIPKVRKEGNGIFPKGFIFRRGQNLRSERTKTRTQYVPSIPDKMNDPRFRKRGRNKVGRVTFVWHLEYQTPVTADAPNIDCMFKNCRSNHAPKMLLICDIEEARRSL